MKHRLLSVDDDPLILQGLRRSLHGMRTEYDLEFAGRGVHARAAMSNKPCDAVVTDINMPGMNGAELLAELFRRHLQTVRLVRRFPVTQTRS